jgi:hypothetical protein
MEDFPDRATFELRLNAAWHDGGVALISTAMRQYDQLLGMLKLLPEQEKRKMMLDYTVHLESLMTALTTQVAPIIEKQLEAARSKLK